MLEKEKLPLGVAGTSKNLEIIFCESKFEEFVRASNMVVSQMYTSSKDLGNSQKT